MKSSREITEQTEINGTNGKIYNFSFISVCSVISLLFSLQIPNRNKNHMLFGILISLQKDTEAPHLL
jgi:hypothetical protein